MTSTSLPARERTAIDVSYEQLLEMMPAALRAALPSGRWRLDLLWALQLPSQEIALTDLVWIFDLPLWQLSGQRFALAPSQVLNTPERYPQHYQNILAADLIHPIHILRYRQRLVVLDGVHRLARALLERAPTIKTMPLSPADFERICRH